MPSSTVELFLGKLKESNLLSADQLAAVRGEIQDAGPAEKAHAGSDPRRESAAAARTAVRPAALRPPQIADSLVARGLLTRWQADRLLANHTAFFLGRYKLLDRIGAGGMGAVFKAQHAGLGRLVALKIMASTLVRNRTAVARFHQEIQAAAALDHPNIVVAYDADSVGDTHFLVMEHVDGRDLGGVLKERPRLPVAWACECIRQAALGLQHAYERGMVHRDIKPTNLMVTTDPETGGPLVKILDLGLARFVSEVADDAGLTQTGQMLGTPDYIAPEQAADMRHADIRSDLFSLGCTLFRLLSGGLPFAGRNLIEKLMSRALYDATRLRSLRPDAPAELEAVVARMLAREPRQRYQTPAEVATALAPFASSKPLSAYPAEPPGSLAPVTSPDSPLEDDSQDALENFLKHLATEADDNGAPLPSRLLADGGADISRKTPARNTVGGTRGANTVDVSPAGGSGIDKARRLVLAVAVIGVVLLASASGAIWYRTGAAELVIEWPRDEREDATLVVDGKPHKLPAEGKLVLPGRPGVRRIHATRRGYEVVDSEVELHRGSRHSWKPDWIPAPRTMRRMELEEFRRRIRGRAGADVNSAAAIALRGALAEFVYQHHGTPEVIAAAQLLPQVAWPVDQLLRQQIPNEELRSAGSGNASRAPRELVAIFGDSRFKQWNRTNSVDINANGTLVAASSLDGTVKIWNVAAGQELETLFLNDDPVRVLFAPSGLLLATVGSSRGVALWETGEGKLSHTLSDTTWPIAFSADGRRLAANSRRRGITLWDSATGEVQRTLAIPPAGGPLLSLEFNATGELLLSSQGDHVARVWNLPQGRIQFSLEGTQMPRFSPDGKQIAAGMDPGNAGLWDAAGGQLQRTLEDAGNPLAFAADGRKLATLRNERVMVWDSATGNELRTVTEVAGRTALSRDGNYLAAGDSHFGWLKLWNLATGAATSTPGHARAITCLAFAPDSAMLATGSDDHTVKVWNSASGTEQIVAGAGVGPADLSLDGRILAFGTEDGSIKLWDVAARKSSRTFETHARSIQWVQFSPNREFLSALGDWGFFATTLRLWDAGSGRELNLLGDLPGNLRMAAFSPDSRLLATAGDGRVVAIWSLETLKLLRRFDDHPDQVRSLAFSADGRQLAVSCRNYGIKIWDVASEREQAFGEQITNATSLAFSPDGKLLAAGTPTDEIHLWQLPGGKLHRQLSAPGRHVNSLSFNAEGSRLAAANSTGRIHIWETPYQTAEPQQTLTIGPAGGIVSRASYTPDGRHLLTVNGNGTVYLLRLQDFVNGQVATTEDR